VIVGAQDIPGVGRFAMLADPAGAPFAIITSSSS
jgi:predicted enzyme related to lactoylglutathione lyase